MSQTTVSIRMDENVKKEFEEFCAQVGMNVSVAVNLFAKAVIRERRIPFEIVLAPEDAETSKPEKKSKKSKED